MPLSSFPLRGDGVRDFSDASPLIDIGSSGDDADVLASFRGVSERREHIVDDLTLCGLAVTPIFEALTTVLTVASAVAATASVSGGNSDATTPGFEPEPVGAFKMDTSTS